MRWIKFLFAWIVIFGLIAAGLLGIANIGSAVAVQPGAGGQEEAAAGEVRLKQLGEDEAVLSTSVGKLVGVRLRNPLNELVGSIKAVAADVRSARVYAVIDYSAPPIGRTKTVIVPISKIAAQPGKEEYRLNVGRYQLENAPVYSAGDFTSTLPAHWSKGNLTKLVFAAPKKASSGDAGFLDRFVRGLKVIWSRITS